MSTKPAASNNTHAKPQTTQAGDTNSKVQFVPVSEDEDKKYEDLHSRHLDLTDEEEAEYLALAKKIRAAKAARKHKIDEIRTELRTLAFSIKDIFDQDEIDAAATQKAVQTQASGRRGAKASQEQNADKGELWIKISGRGAPKYYKGQLYKNLSEKQKTAKDFSRALGQTLPKNWLTNDSIEIMMNSATPEAKKLYEDKDPGFMAEMNDLLSAIKTHPHYIAAKGGATADKKSDDKQAA